MGPSGLLRFFCLVVCLFVGETMGNKRRKSLGDGFPFCFGATGGSARVSQMGDSVFFLLSFCFLTFSAANQTSFGPNLRLHSVDSRTFFNLWGEYSSARV